MFPYPQTLSETLEQVRHREKRWREKQNATNERTASVRNTYVPNPNAYTATGQNNHWNRSRPNRSYNQPRQSYQGMNPWRNGLNGNRYSNGYGYNGNRPNVWVNRQRRNSDPTGRHLLQCQICKRSNHTAAICYYRYSGRPEPNQGSANNRIQPDNLYNGYGNPTYAETCAQSANAIVQ